MALDKKLMDVIVNLNDKRGTDIKPKSKATRAELAALILEHTDNGADLTKLGRTERATVKKLVEEFVQTDESVEEHIDTPLDESDAVVEGELLAPEDEAQESSEVNGTQPELTRDDLNAAAHDMNTIMGLKPGIDTTEADDEKFMKMFEKAVSMATGTDNFLDSTWATFAALEIGPERVLQAPVKTNNNKKAKEALDSAAPTKDKKAKAPREKKPSGPGVIGTIQKCLDDAIAAKKNITITAIHEALVEAFPERDANSLLSTVKVQIPSRIAKEKGYTFEKIALGEFKVSK